MMGMNDEMAIEQQLVASNADAPRLTPADIDAVIQSADYHRVPDSTVTICSIRLVNGFIVNGSSAAASPVNFDAEIGRKLAYQDAREKIWELEGYLLRQRLYEAEQAA